MGIESMDGPHPIVVGLVALIGVGLALSAGLIIKGMNPSKERLEELYGKPAMTKQYSDVNDINEPNYASNIKGIE
jgi:hypothetical protein